MFSNAKRGQAAAGAAVLLAIVAGLLVMFIILLPPQERAELLGENLDEDNNGTISKDTELEDAIIREELLEVSPGKIDFLAQREMEHPLPVVNIYTRTEGKILAEKNIAYAKRGVFSEENTMFSFPITDLANTKNILLSFSVQSVKGRLVISLNDEEIFNGEVNKGGIDPIPLPRNSLKEINEMIFSVSSPGVAFWVTNEASVVDIQVVADVTDTQAQSSKNVFLVSETEKRNLERVFLKFQPDCEFVSVGKLRVAVNGNELYNAVPDCDVRMVPIEFSPDLLYQGENQITFMTEKGTYVLSNILIGSQLKEVDFPTYYFELSKEQFEDIVNEKRRVRLTMDFVDIITRKTGDLVFNGHVNRFDTKEVVEIVDISDDVVQGNNAIKIKPRRTLEIRELKIDLVS